jgi:hypothetical protein
MTGREFYERALRASTGVKGEGIVMTVTGNPSQVPEVLGLLAGGAKVFALPNFFGREIADHLTGLVASNVESLPNGSLASVSSGTSGAPKVNVVQPYFMQTETVEEMVSWGREVMPALLDGRAFMTAPLQTTILSYLAALALGVPLSMTTERPSAAALEAFVQPDDLSIMTKGPVVRKLWEAGYRRKFECFVSASGTLGEDTIAQSRVVFDNPEIIDIYSCTEAGILGARKADQPFFQMAPMVHGLGGLLVSEMTVGTITHKGYFPKDYVDTGDVIETNGELIRLLGRGKAKVSGFSVFPIAVRDHLRSRGYDIKSVYVEDGSLVCAHGGVIDQSSVSSELESYGLPSFSIPQRFVAV